MKLGLVFSGALGGMLLVAMVQVALHIGTLTRHSTSLLHNVHRSLDEATRRLHRFMAENKYIDLNQKTLGTLVLLEPQLNSDYDSLLLTYGHDAPSLTQDLFSHSPFFFPSSQGHFTIAFVQPQKIQMFLLSLEPEYELHSLFSNVGHVSLKVLQPDPDDPLVLTMVPLQSFSPRPSLLLESSPEQETFAVPCAQPNLPISRLMVKYRCAPGKRCVMVRMGVLVLKQL